MSTQHPSAGRGARTRRPTRRPTRRLAAALAALASAPRRLLERDLRAHGAAHQGHPEADLVDPRHRRRPRPATTPTQSYDPWAAFPVVSQITDARVSEILKRGYLVVGVSADTYLFGARDPFTSQITGFDIDMAKAVATSLFGSAQAPAARHHRRRPHPAAAGRARSTWWRAT